MNYGAEVRRPTCFIYLPDHSRGVNVCGHIMSKSFQPTRLVGAIAIAMGFHLLFLLKIQRMQLSLTQLLSLLQKC